MMRYTPEQIGRMVREARKAMGVTQQVLALTSGTGLRFISDLEKGKPTCQLGKVLTVLHTLGIRIMFDAPIGDKAQGNGGYRDSSGDGKNT